MPCGPCGRGNIGLPIVRSTRPYAAACITSPRSSGPMEAGGRCGSATRISPTRRTRFTAHPRCSWPIAISIKSKAPGPDAAWTGWRPPLILAGAGAAGRASPAAHRASKRRPWRSRPCLPRRAIRGGRPVLEAGLQWLVRAVAGVASSPSCRYRPAPGPIVVLRKGLSAGLHRFGVRAGREAALRPA